MVDDLDLPFWRVHDIALFAPGVYNVCKIFPPTIEGNIEIIGVKTPNFQMKTFLV